MKVKLRRNGLMESISCQKLNFDEDIYEVEISDIGVITLTPYSKLFQYEEILKAILNILRDNYNVISFITSLTRNIYNNSDGERLNKLYENKPFKNQMFLDILMSDTADYYENAKIHNNNNSQMSLCGLIYPIKINNQIVGSVVIPDCNIPKDKMQQMINVIKNLLSLIR
jgi:hypothetical protein